MFSAANIVDEKAREILLKNEKEQPAIARGKLRNIIFAIRILSRPSFVECQYPSRTKLLSHPAKCRRPPNEIPNENLLISQRNSKRNAKRKFWGFQTKFQTKIFRAPNEIPNDFFLSSQPNCNFHWFLQQCGAILVPFWGHFGGHVGGIWGACWEAFWGQLRLQKGQFVFDKCEFRLTLWTTPWRTIPALLPFLTPP